MSDEKMLEEYLDYFVIGKDCIYIRHDFKERLGEFDKNQIKNLFGFILGKTYRERQKHQKAFVQGKRYKIVSSYQKERIPDDFRWAVFERDNFTCRKCGSRRRLTVDHIEPESRGGELTIENAQTLCKHCNSQKGAK